MRIPGEEQESRDKDEEKDNDNRLAAVIRRARRRTMLRSTLISLGVTLVVLVGGYIGNVQLTNHFASAAMTEEWRWQEITGPNEYEADYTDMRGFLSGRLELRTYKVVEGVPIPWETKNKAYNVLPVFELAVGGGGSSSLSVPDPAMEQGGYEYSRAYNPFNGQREMLFYVPGVNYNGKILNDLQALGEMDPDKLVEMAVSFDKSRTLDEVRAMLPAAPTQVWYWVDTYDNKQRFEPRKIDKDTLSYALPEQAGWVYGFGVKPDWPKADAAAFLREVKAGAARKGEHAYEYRRIYDYLRQNKAEPTAADVRLLGVVVTGTARELAALQGQPYVRAAVLGAIADRY